MIGVGITRGIRAVRRLRATALYNTKELVVEIEAEISQYNEWEVTQQGLLRKVSNTAAEKDKLFSVTDDRGNITRAKTAPYITLRRGVLDKIYNSQVVGRFGPHPAVREFEVIVGAEHGLEIVKVFLFYSQRTEFEWSLSYAENRQGERMFGLRTIGERRHIQTALRRQYERGEVRIFNNIHSHPARWMGYDQTEIESMRTDIEIVEGNPPPQFGVYVFIGRTSEIWRITRNRNGVAVPTNERRMTPEQLHTVLTTPPRR